MIQHDSLQHYLDAVIEQRCYRSRGNLQFLMETLYRGIEFRGKRVLDIGGGCGRDSFYAASQGAREIVCLEPEAAGSSSTVVERFRGLRAALACENVTLRTESFQAFEPDEEPFDLVILHNSVNHLDEAACVNLLTDESAKATYRELFIKAFRLSSYGAKLIMCDCSRYNFFALMNIRNPMARQIEWQKHQSPRVWAQLLYEAGFGNAKIRWSSFNALRTWGRVLIGNQVASYFLRSHFHLVVEKSSRITEASLA